MPPDGSGAAAVAALALLVIVVAGPTGMPAPPVAAALVGAPSSSGARAATAFAFYLQSSPDPVDPGIGIVFNAASSGGAGPYSYAWTWGDGATATSSGLDSHLVHTYGKAGTYLVVVNATDGGGETLSANVTQQVVPLPVAAEPNASAASADVGQTVVFRTTASLGVPPYSNYNWSGLPPNCTGPPFPRVTCALGSTGTFEIKVRVTDLVGGVSPWGPPRNFTVDPAPVVAAPAANRSSVDVGQAVAFGTQASQGAGTYRYIWGGLPPGCAGTDDPVTCSPTAPGWFNVTVVAVDANNASSPASPALPFAVDPDVAVNLTASRTSLDLGQPVTMDAAASGGAGNLSYAWTGLPAGCVSTTATLACTPASAGTFNIAATVEDANMWSTTAKVVLQVDPALAATMTASIRNATVGATVRFTAAGQGGSGSYAYAWELGDGTTATGPRPSHAYGRPGTYEALVWVNDTAGSSVEKGWNVTVTSPPPSGSVFLGLPASEGYALAGAVAFVVAAAAIAAGARARRSRTPPSER
jgi:PKD repeat protein